MQAHVPVDVHDFTNYIAAFLICTGNYSYFGCGYWTAVGNDTRPLTWHPEYDRPLGAPNGPAVYNFGVWTRSFVLEQKKLLTLQKNKGTIKWSKQLL